MAVIGPDNPLTGDAISEVGLKRDVTACICTNPIALYLKKPAEIHHFFIITAFQVILVFLLIIKGLWNQVGYTKRGST
jgi:hypothetical protein